MLENQLAVLVDFVENYADPTHNPKEGVCEYT